MGDDCLPTHAVLVYSSRDGLSGVLLGAVLVPRRVDMS